MSVTVTQSVTALSQGINAWFLGHGGTPPYTYSVAGAGGTINASSGKYVAPAAFPTNPSLSEDTITVTDSLAATATTTILITNALGLFCDIIQKEMGLTSGRVYLWDQKIEQPKDVGLYVAVSILNLKPFGNTNNYQSTMSGLENVQSLNVRGQLQVDIISRGPEALNRKEEVLMSLYGNYSQTQQTTNSFYIAPLSTNFVNLSQIDGAAIPYRYSITVNIQYFVKKIKDVPYFDTFEDVDITVEP